MQCRAAVNAAHDKFGNGLKITQDAFMCMIGLL